MEEEKDLFTGSFFIPSYPINIIQSERSDITVRAGAAADSDMNLKIRKHASLDRAYSLFEPFEVETVRGVPAGLVSMDIVRKYKNSLDAISRDRE